jgi:hypothetical protein
MPFRFSTISTLGALLASVGVTAGATRADDAPSEVSIRHFRSAVLPILKSKCLKCHGLDEKIKGGLRLTSKEAILEGGDSGPAIDIDDPEASVLLQAIHYDGLEMPPSGKLPTKEIKVIENWVRQGAPWPPGLDLAKVTIGTITAEDRAYWAYAPRKAVAPPQVKNPQWVRNPIDAFVHAGLDEQNISPAPEADRRTLIRRLSYDLTGLPPSPEQVEAFEKSQDPNAYEKLVDSLLASPHYGERWARHWLDIVRYAETNGYERDGPKPFAWRYRDYVIRSFNDDKPFDRFVREQIAGDELADKQWNADAVIAAGYYRLGVWDDEPADPLQARYDELDDIVATTAQTFLGMTMNCARCHDHKIDPVPQKDYYRFLAFFADVPRLSNDRNVRSSNSLADISSPEDKARYEAEFRSRQAKIDALRAQMETIENAAIKKMSAEEQRASEGLDRPHVVGKIKGFLAESEWASYEKLRDERTKLEKMPDPRRDLALSVNNVLVRPEPTHLLARGNPHSPTEPVKPGFPSVIDPNEPTIPEPSKDARKAGRRSVLAEWIASPDNPLTARVIVNRLWQHHFGRGIVATPNDFGQYGERPSHPELLDWLADDLVSGGWKLKRLHKLICMSATYRMSSDDNSQAMKVDPANQLLWRFPMRRLSAEELRDSMLDVAGLLDRKMYGESIYPRIPAEVLAGQSVPGQGWPTTRPEDSNRRSIYVHVKRSLRLPILSMYDQADTDTSCPARYVTIVPTQALGHFNGAFTQEVAKAFAARLAREEPKDEAARVRRGIRLTTGRMPSQQEAEQDLAFVRGLISTNGLSPEMAWTQYAVLLLNTNEFVYLD